MYKIVWVLFLFVRLSTSEHIDEDNIDKESEFLYRNPMIAMLAKNMAKKLPDFLHKYNLSDVLSEACFKSWNRFSTESGIVKDLPKISEGILSPEGKEVLKKLISPKKCHENPFGKFCRLTFNSTFKTGNKLRKFSYDYGMCYPEGCTEADLDSILEKFSENFQQALQLKIVVLGCDRSSEEEEVNIDQVILHNLPTINRTLTELTNNSENSAMIDRVMSYINLTHTNSESQNAASNHSQCDCLPKASNESSSQDSQQAITTPVVGEQPTTSPIEVVDLLESDANRRKDMETLVQEDKSSKLSSL